MVFVLSVDVAIDKNIKDTAGRTVAACPAMQSVDLGDQPGGQWTTSSNISCTGGMSTILADLHQFYDKSKKVVAMKCAFSPELRATA